MKYTTKQLKYEDILQYVSEEDIALFYLGVTSNCKLFSYFREETNPGKYLYYKNGRMQYFDCIESRSLPYLIMELNNWSYSQFILHLRQDLLGKVVSTGKKKNTVKLDIINSSDKRTIIQIKSRSFQEYDLDFWGQGGITLEWLTDIRRKIKPLEYFWINDYINIAEKYCYCYDYYKNKNIMRRKIYQPYSTDRKWISNIDNTVLQNWDALPKYNGQKLIITSSYKDSGVVECNLTLPDSRYYFPSCAPNNEGTFLPEIVVPKIKNRFDKVYTWFDQDLAGHNAANKYEIKYGYTPIFIPEYFKNNYNIKDPFEFISKFGKGKFIELSNYLLYERN